ncbi:MAG: hypothetical protein JST26_13675 [Bacteroidetes bacterium]|nr:hypothetical protein [Bacteroidota bacterium]
MLKILNIRALHRAFTSAVAWVLVWSLLGGLLSSFAPHPYYLGVTEIKYNSKTSVMELSMKLFTGDLEDALRKTTGKPVDLLNPKDKAEMYALLRDYIKKRFTLKINGNISDIHLLGYEKEEDAVWIYMQTSKVKKPKTVDIDNSLLFDYLPQQIQIVHVTVGDSKQSAKVTNPDHIFSFRFQ